MVILVLTGLMSERLVPRRSLDRQLRERDAELVRALAERQDRADFYREAHTLERQRNDVLNEGLVTVVKEIRAAVGDPTRPL